MPSCQTCLTPLETSDTRTFCPACVLREMWAEDDEPVLEEGELEAASPLPEVPRFQLWNKLGEGGFAIVYRAEQLEPVRREVAVKVLKREVSSHDVLARFEAERQTLARMDHPGIARLWDAGQTSAGQPYFAMELVHGLPVTSYAKSKNLGMRERLELFTEVCDAVQHAHEKGVLHRDIKPANLLVSEVNGKRRVKVIDFGIAKALEILPDESRSYVTAMHQAIGTPGYMSPEQAEWGSQIVDVRSDIYALGVVLYELLTGCTPLEHQRKSSAEAKRRAVADQAKSPSSMPETLLRSRNQRRDLDAITLKALEHDSAQRYASAAALADDVRRHLADVPVEASQQPWTYVLSKFARRHRALVSAMVVALLAILGGATASLLLYFKEQRAHQRAELARAEVEAQQATLRRALGQSHFAAAQRFKGEGDNESAVLSLSRALDSDPSLTIAADDMQMLLAYSDFLQPLEEPIPLRPEWGNVTRASLAVSGRIIAAHMTGSGNGELLVSWQANDTTGWDAKVMPLPKGLSKMCLSGPGTTLGIVEDKSTVCLYAIGSTEPLRTWVCPYLITSIIISFQETPTALIGCNDGSLWEMTSNANEEPRQVAKVTGSVREIMLVPSAKSIIIGSSTGEVRRWQSWGQGEGELILKLPGAITVLTQLQTGTVIAAGDATGYVGCYSAKARSMVAAPVRVHASTVSTLALSVPAPLQVPLAKRAENTSTSTSNFETPTIVSTGQDLMVHWRNLETGADIVPPMESAGFVIRAVIGRDGQEVTLVSRDSSVRLWRRGDPNPHELRKPQRASVVADGSIGRSLLAKRDDGRAMEVLSLVQRTTIAMSLHPAGPRDRGSALPRTLTFARSGKELMSSDGMGAALLWNPLTAEQTGEARWDGAALASHGLENGSYLLAMKNGSSKIATADGNSPATELDATQHQVDRTLEFFRRSSKSQGEKAAAPRPEPTQWTIASISPPGDAVAWGEISPTNTAGTWVRVFRRSDGSLVRFLTQRLSTLAIGPGGRQIAIGLGNGVINIHNLDTLSSVQIIAHQTRITALAFTRDGTGLLSGSSDSTIALWDIQTGAKRGIHLRVGAPVVNLCMSGDGRRFACSTESYTLAGDLAGWSIIGSRLPFPAFGQATALDYHGTRLALAVTFGATLVFDLPTSSTAPPPWFQKLVSGFVSRKFSPTGVIESTEHPGSTALRSLIPKEGNDAWANLARWLLASRTGRQLSPWGSLTVENYVQEILKREGPDALMEARRRIGVKFIQQGQRALAKPAPRP